MKGNQQSQGLLALMTFLFFAFLLRSGHGAEFRFEREGKSRFIQKNESLLIQKYNARFGDQTFFQDPKEQFEEAKSCGIQFVKNLKSFNSLDEGERPQEILLLGLRKEQVFDDIVLDILLKSLKVKYNWSLPSGSQKKIREHKQKEAIFGSVKQFFKQVERGQCLEDAYLSFVSGLGKFKLKGNKDLKAINFASKREKIISKSQFKVLESLRQGKVFVWKNTIRTYLKKRSQLRRQRPLSHPENSDFVAKKNKNFKMSLRQNLYEKYTFYQIFLMGDLISKLRSRLEAQEISIIIRYGNEDDEEIPLSPMEQFRFLLKLLRKDLSDLNNSELFQGRNATFEEVIAAAYEVGFVPANEVEEVASLEEIWNPKQTLREKVFFWVKTFGRVGSVLLPQPVGFVSLLAIMGIESFYQNNRRPDDPDYALF